MMISYKDWYDPYRTRNAKNELLADFGAAPFQRRPGAETSWEKGRWNLEEFLKIIELDYGKILTGKPIKFDGKNHGFL